jgi:preprotein translocase subunit SecA
MVLPTGRDNDRKPAEEIVNLIETRAREAYARREIEYPVDHMLAFAFGQTDGQQLDNPYAADYVRAWARAKYGVELTLEHLAGLSLRKLRDELIGYQEKALKDGGLAEEIDKITAETPQPEAMVQAFNRRFGANFTLAALTRENGGRQLLPQASGGNESPVRPELESENGADTDFPPMRQLLFHKARGFLRQELTDLEQYVLIQIFDQTWKDHLYAMDILKGSVGLAGFAEKDPRIIFKKEGFEYFKQMMQGVRDKVTDLIFRARIVGAAQARNAYRETAAVHEEAGGYGVTENLAATAGVEKGDEIHTRAEEAQGEVVRTKTIVREVPKVGRNDLCPCGSGKKYKKCCGANVA